MVFLSFGHSNDLVDENYYAREIAYQDIIDRKANASALPERLEWKQDENGLLLIFPQTEGKAEGIIEMLRPSGKDADRIFTIALNSDNAQFLNSAELIPGKYHYRVTWSAAGTEYFEEGEIFAE